MRFAYYNRLTSDQKRVYRLSDGIHEITVPAGTELGARISAVAAALKHEERAATQVACQALVDELAVRLKVPPVRVAVHASRPPIRGGELHGLYEPDERARVAKISVWMRTAQRKQVVAFRTFLRTLIHEFCHHLDYELFKLPETFHTEGFYKRESSLLHQLLPSGNVGAAPRGRKNAG